MEFFELEAELLANGSIPVKKYRLKGSSLNVYFADVDSQVINGYFCYGVDQPEGTGIETLLWHLDSSGGLLPRQMRGDMLRPAWQFHGAENPLADRDQSCFVCCALGEVAFLGTFSCCVYLLQNLEAVFEIHGLSGSQASEAASEPGAPEAQQNKFSSYGVEAFNEGDGDAESEPQLNGQEYYCLSEAGEGAMAWEATLQALFPGCRAFWNRLLCDAKTKLSPKMRQCYDMFYRPENLSVIITGTVKHHGHILETLYEYHNDFKDTHPNAPLFVAPWSAPLPPSGPATTSEVRFVPRNPTRAPSASVCFGWRGTTSNDLETALALKVMTAHLAVGPLWDQFVTSGLAHRISWCQLEYLETCSLITMHGIKNDESLEKVCTETKQIISDMADAGKPVIKLEEVRAMADRVGWHHVRELEADPFLIIAASISKAERYGRDDKDQLQKRIHPRLVFDALLAKPVEYWQDLLKVYFVDSKTFVTKILPKSYTKEPEEVTQSNSFAQSEVAENQSFAATSRRASSRPRGNRKANPVGEESNVVDLNDGDGSKLVEASKAQKEIVELKEGHIEEFMKNTPFPFGAHAEEAKGFEERLQMTATFLEQVLDSDLLSYPITSHRSDDVKQHPSFPLNEMPFFTFLEDLECSFVYATMVLDTTHLDEATRKLISPITAALGAILCPRPPGLDTDCEIVNPCEFNPPQNISDSQVSLGLNGEMMQSIFVTMIVRPEHYRWLVGMFNFLLYKHEFSVSFLKFVSEEAAKGLASNYRMQTADVPNYHCFDSTEINLHSLVKMIYKEDSNARLFVGRRRLDLVNDYLEKMSQNPDEVAKKTNAAWRKIVDDGRIVVQLAGQVSGLAASQGSLAAPWKECFTGIQKSREFLDVQPILEPEMMKTPGIGGISVAVNHARPPCLTTAIPINPNDKDFPKLCIAAQLFSMAQKWVWACMDEDDVPQPVLRMPCSYSNIMTLNLESTDVVGAFEAMQQIVKEDWQWLNCMLIATKLMVVNDPAATDQGPQGAIASALMSHLSGQPACRRRDILMESLKVTVEDIRSVIRDHLSKLFDPKNCWYSLMTHGSDEKKLIERFEQKGFNLSSHDLNELCTTL